MSNMMRVDWRRLSPWDGFNVRRFFNPESEKMLAESIRRYGVRTPLEVAQDPEHAGGWKIVCGERRWRATKALVEELEASWKDAEDREEIDAQIERLSKMDCRMVTNEEAEHLLELNLIENLHRDQLLPVEEADGFERLRQLRGKDGLELTIGEVARRVGVPEKYVSRRLQLRRAPVPLLEAVNGGSVPASIAELIGRIPDKEDRELAADLVLRPRGPYAPEQELALNYEQTKQMLRAHFMVSLDKCGFSPEDHELLPVERDEAGQRIRGGSCRDCPHRSGNMVELDALEEGTTRRGGQQKGGDRNLCTNPACFNAKRDAAWMIVKRTAEARGQRVLDGDAARMAFSGYSGRLATDAPYVYAEECPWGTEVHWRTDAPTWAELIEGTDVDTVLARNPFTHAQEVLVDRKLAIAAARRKARSAGVESVFDKPRDDGDEEGREKWSVDEGPEDATAGKDDSVYRRLMKVHLDAALECLEDARALALQHELPSLGFIDQAIERVKEAGF